ncbi:expressed protein [Echinococcus multilocularis]|uniref:Expressed protein n=1 Tax=Echinococcus multilocularis TaxID=6211 RepID=A0A068Y133_ECHMU|nr:expressed protein [Echinococcus multilocularis]
MPTTPRRHEDSSANSDHQNVLHHWYSPGGIHSLRRLEKNAGSVVEFGVSIHLSGSCTNKFQPQKHPCTCKETIFIVVKLSDDLTNRISGLTLSLAVA